MLMVRLLREFLTNRLPEAMLYTPEPGIDNLLPTDTWVASLGSRRRYQGPTAVRPTSQQRALISEVDDDVPDPQLLATLECCNRQPSS
jgi:hypothetical protein